MKKFEEYLRNKMNIPEKRIPYYIVWVSKFKDFSLQNKGKQQEDCLEPFLKNMTQTNEPWQIDQAEEAVKLYFYFNRPEQPLNKASDIRTMWKEASEKMTQILRLQQKSLNTERIYLKWIRDFYTYIKAKNPTALDEKDVSDFMTFLAVERKISSSTQNQAFNAVLFFFRFVLDKELKEVKNAVRAKKRKTLPIVLPGFCTEMR